MSEQEQLKRESTDHWLVRPKTIRMLWWGGSIVLVITVALQLLVPAKGYFGVDGWFAFGAVFGFAACVAMVLFAKLLGLLLKRGEDYYAAGHEEGSDHD